MSERRCNPMHWATWLLLLLVCGVLVYLQLVPNWQSPKLFQSKSSHMPKQNSFDSRQGLRSTHMDARSERISEPAIIVADSVVQGSEEIRSYVVISYFGWPLVHVEQRETGLAAPGPGRGGQTFEYRWTLSSLEFNVVAWLIIAGSMVFVFQRWLRSPRPTQFTIRKLLVGILIAAIGMTLVIQRLALMETLGQLGLHPSAVLEADKIDSPAVYPIRILVILGVGCSIYAAFLLTLWPVARAFNFARNRSTASNGIISEE